MIRRIRKVLSSPPAADILAFKALGWELPEWDKSGKTWQEGCLRAAWTGEAWSITAAVGKLKQDSVVLGSTVLLQHGSIPTGAGMAAAIVATRLRALAAKYLLMADVVNQYSSPIRVVSES